MYWFGLFLVILGTVFGTLTFCLTDRNDRGSSLGTLYWVALLIVVWGAYVLYPVST